MLLFYIFLSNNANSCDILEYAIGKCESIVPYHPCAHKIEDQVCVFCVLQNFI